MNLNKTKFFNSDEVYISSKMNEYLKNNFGYEITGDLASLSEAKASLEATKAELKDEYMSKAYVENMLMIETIKSLLKAHGASGTPTIIKEDEVSDSVIAQQGDYTFRRTKSDIFHLEYKGTLIASGDYDSGASAFFMDNPHDDGQSSFDSGKDVIEYYMKHDITEPADAPDINFSSESVTEEEGEEEEKGPKHYRWKNDSQLSIALDKLEACMAQLDVAIEYRATNSHLFFNTGDKAGTGDLQRMKEQLEKLRDGWDESTELYGM